MLSELLSALNSGDKNYLIITVISILISLPIILFSLAMHEAAHAFAAYRMGDRTARNLGRLTLNPAKHLDLLGTISMFLFGFGWAKPVPINARYFKNPKWGMAISAFAGPLSNLGLSLIGAIGFQITLRFIPVVCGGIFIPTFYAGMPTAHLIMTILLNFFYLFAYYNAALAIFNLLPIPPFDGSRLAFVFLPDKWYWGIMKYERIIMIIILVGLATDFLAFPFQNAAEGIVNFFMDITSFIGG
ncbi:MAG: site-2 protease family protein [Ruminococcaceae bacterium]|nr:site-2 protease family protein [Oscillospiraceae bacterium]